MADERDAWWRFARATVGVGFETVFRVRFAGLEHVPRTGGALLTYNHVSVLDPVPVALGAHRRGRMVRFLSVTEAFDQLLVGWGLRRLRQVPLHRGAGDRAALASAIEAIRDGGLVGMSPEGTVGDGRTLQRGHTGAARIVMASAAPVIPVAVWGTQHRWPKTGPRAGGPVRPAVAVAFGPPLAMEGDPESMEDVRAATERIMEALALQVEVARTRT